MNKKPVREWVVDLLLSCTHIAIEGLENQFALPQKDSDYFCLQCKKNVKIIDVGRTYQIAETRIKKRS